MGTVGFINQWVDMIMVATFIAVAIVGGVAFYLLKVKKVAAKEEKINYSNFRREDVREFNKFDNVIQCSTGNGDSKFGICVIDDNTFLSALDIKGYNFSSASEEDRLRTIINSVSFYNTVERPIQLRQSSKAIDISYNIEKQKEICKNLDYKQLELEADYEDTLRVLQENENNADLFGDIEKQLLKLQKTIMSVKWQAKEAAAVLRYLSSFSTMGAAVKENQLIFSYTYDPNDDLEELSEAEIYMKASNELANMANNFSASLGNCGCSCKLLTGMEYLDLVRRHNHPKTADIVKVRDLCNSSYQALFVASDSLMRSARRILGERRFKEQMREYAENSKNNFETTMEDAALYADKLENAVMNAAQEELDAQE